MKITKTYFAPQCEVRKTRVRISILAGSDKAINGTSKGDVRVSDMPWDNGVRVRVSID
ncbi:MAG: hypothetical protein J5663_01155 [Bacteroidaceae bacterium]|nr:hypothetical protein [Bacteroidaceae bacterium]